MLFNFNGIKELLSSAFSIGIMAVAIVIISKAFKGNMKAIFAAGACVLVIAIIFSIGHSDGGEGLGTTLWDFVFRQGKAKG